MKKRYFCVLILIVCVFTVFADENKSYDMSAEIGIVTTGDIESNIELVGDNVNLNTNIYSNNGTVSINGENLDSIYSKIENYVSSSNKKDGTSLSNMFNHLSDLFLTATLDLSEIHNPNFEKFEVHFYNVFVNYLNNQLIKPFNNVFKNIFKEIGQLYYSIRNIDTRLNNLENWVGEVDRAFDTDSINKDSICWGKVKYAYLNNLSQVECDGFVFEISSISGKGDALGMKVRQVENKGHIQPVKSKENYIVVNQTELLKIFERDCYRSQQMDYQKGIEKYCRSECNGGNIKKCVCRNGKTKVMEWVVIDDKQDIKEAKYYCVEN
ncbi:hypothetical protein GF322_00530 [Candidatus Dependentiae bacterium]|nr:hypothetical protein [Candidatus Dependentiae bacterium]